MARGRVYTTPTQPGYRVDGYRVRWARPYRLMVAEVRDKEGRVIWSDNTRFSTRSHAAMLAATSEVVRAVDTLERLGHRLEWDWQGCVGRAPRL